MNMRVTMAVAFATGALGLAAVGTSGLAAAQPVDKVQDMNDRFISQLDATGIPAPPAEEAISLAHNVCEKFASGVGQQGALGAVGDLTDLNVWQSQIFVYESVGVYCPQYIDMIN